MLKEEEKEERRKEKGEKEENKEVCFNDFSLEQPTKKKK
jgi:hypothetical protein